MSNVKRRSSNKSRKTKSITVDLGRIPTLPGESEEEFEQGLQSLIEELEAKTVMQIYLAEKIFECLWWMRRYEEQKRTTLAVEMVYIVKQIQRREPIDDSEVLKNLEQALETGIEEVFTQVETPYQALMQKAFENKSADIEAYNKQIHMLTKTLSGFQASYEVLTNRKLHIERLHLQNKLLEKDLSAVEMQALPNANQFEKKGS